MSCAWRPSSLRRSCAVRLCPRHCRAGAPLANSAQRGQSPDGSSLPKVIWHSGLCLVGVVAGVLAMPPMVALAMPTVQPVAHASCQARLCQIATRIRANPLQHRRLGATVSVWRTMSRSGTVRGIQLPCQVSGMAHAGMHVWLGLDLLRQYQQVPCQPRIVQGQPPPAVR